MSFNFEAKITAEFSKYKMSKEFNEKIDNKLEQVHKKAMHKIAEKYD